MTAIAEDPTVTVESVTYNLYRDIHKGIRAELFGVTSAAGSINPADRAARTALAARITTLAIILEVHAEDEDRVLQPPTELYLPEVADTIERDHARFDQRVHDFTALADDAIDAPRSEQRARVEQVYMELAAFTGLYLAHQDVEERLVMPGLERALGVDACFALHAAIVSSIPPDQMAQALAIMLPAMNIDDRTELLGGMQQGAPAEVFEGIWGLAGFVLASSDRDELGLRLGLSHAS